jgi:hypothetical protein
MSTDPYDQHADPIRADETVEPADRVPGPDHRAGLSTQEANPTRAANRTALQALTAALLVVVGALPLILEFAVEDLEGVLSAELYAWLVGAAALTAALARLWARIMAVPGVNAWLRQSAPWLAPGDPRG